MTDRVVTEQQRRAAETMGDVRGREDCCEPTAIFLEGGDELAVQLRELAFALVLNNRAPIDAKDLSSLIGGDPARTERALEALAREGHIDRDAQGAVLGSAGLTLGSAPHGLQIGGHPFRTWCAFDAIGIPAALAADAGVQTSCAVCGRPIAIDVVGGQPVPHAAARLWLSAGGADLRADFCTPTVLLCSAEHAEEWSARQGGHGRTLSLGEAAELGGRDWASCAAAVTRLATLDGAPAPADG